MAIIVSEKTNAAVTGAIGQDLSANVHFSGELMEMLATTYKFIVMSSIREAIQNACDAAKRSGLSFANGVKVLLPTVDNPVITVIDHGTGMTHQFMTTDYLSFGLSTKKNDDKAAGGLGVGRWAAYGYIRECYITTCHASDMVSRTYFQYQGKDGTPRTQLASEAEGTEVGTRIMFPIKETDITEIYRAVAWLKGIMQLTMNDSFEVDKPGLLAETPFTEFSGSVLELGTVDASLNGVRVYPMCESNLHYSRMGRVVGSLVVMTNQDAGIGGLPFHVGQMGENSVFNYGCIIEIPMSFRLPFMASREELKQTDEATKLMAQIDVAAKRAFVKRCGELYSQKSLESKQLLSKLMFGKVSSNVAPTSLASVAASESGRTYQSDVQKAMGGYSWTGSMRLILERGIIAGDDVQIRYSTNRGNKVVRYDGSNCNLGYADGKDFIRIVCDVQQPLTLVFNDMPSGGADRYRLWRSVNADMKVLYVSCTKNPSKAKAIVDNLNVRFGGQLTAIGTSSMPAVARKVVGKRVVSVSRVGTLTYFCLNGRKQLAASMELDTFNSEEPERLYIVKDGSNYRGFGPDSSFHKLNSDYKFSVERVVGSDIHDRVYYLTTKQENELLTTLAQLESDDLLDASLEDLADQEDGLTLYRSIQALKSWISFESAVSRVVNRERIQASIRGENPNLITESPQLKGLVHCLAKTSRYELTGTLFDKAVSPYVDVLTGESRLLTNEMLSKSLKETCAALGKLAEYLVATKDDSADRTQLLSDLAQLQVGGHVDYGLALKQLVEQFPLARTLALNSSQLTEVELDHVCKAIAMFYRA